ncbi:ribosomal protein L7/L12 [Flavobacterium procerum]|uniref:Ribosomal protein L7/L12 n=1 Tax=Flavobacterium procerum TaxID=1455569 RepID=A0ABV6BYA7_9FLAO
MEFQKYFQSYHDYFWEWENNSDGQIHDAVAISDGQTIGYVQFVVEILDFLSDEGIPPFGSLLMAIAATNPEGEQAIEMIHEIAKKKQLEKNSNPNFRIGASMDFLKILAALPEEYKRGEKRVLLFQTIFKDCHNRISAERAKRCIADYKKRQPYVYKILDKIEFNEPNFIKDFRTLALLKAKFPLVQSLLDAMENIPSKELREKLDDEILEEKNSTETAVGFVDQLIEENKTFQVGSLIKCLWSGFNIPLHHNHPSEQPLGGISDLTNKGDFDKLVISEFAYDDDVFMSRIANNEALFIQREVPPESEKFERILLIDASLKNWGNPKILSFASAIAIARHPKTDIACRAFVLGDTFKEIILENVNQVIDALGELNGKLDCAAGLDLFFKENKINSKSQEVFLFSSEESLKLIPMRNALSTYFSAIKYVFEMQLQTISIYKHQNKGRKQLQQITLPLDELWTVRKNKKYSKKALTGSIPILYPAERSYQNVFGCQDDFYTYINGNLFMFTSEQFDKGFLKIASNLKLGNGNFALKTNDREEKILLCHNSDLKQKVQTFNLNTGIMQEYFVSDYKINLATVNVFVYNNEFYFYSEIDFWHIADDFKLTWLREVKIRQAQLDYSKRKYEFVNSYKFNKLKYTVIKRIDRVYIHQNLLNVNGYTISNFLFEKDNHLARRNGTIRLEERVNLILKNKGKSPLEIVKYIKENTNKSLKEAKDIVDQDFGIVLENVTKSDAEKFKVVLERSGAVCYIEIQYFQSEDGSKISNQDGILVFESSNPEIEKFYIPFIFHMQTAYMSEQEFAGNDYFISEHSQDEIEEENFREKYINPFISNIVGYGF